MNEFWLTIRRRLLFSKLYPTTSQYLPQIAITGRSQPRRTSPEPIELSYRYSYYLVGNHDWFYHLPGSAFESIRASVTGAMGLSNPAGPFPHAPEEYPQLLDIYKEH